MEQSINIENFLKLKNEIIILLEERISATNQCLNYINDDKSSHELQSIIDTNIFYFNEFKKYLLKMQNHNEKLSNYYFNRKLNENEKNQ